MSKRFPKGKAAVGAAIGSAAIAAAMLYVNKRREKKNEPAKQPRAPFGEPPETD